MNKKLSGVIDQNLNLQTDLFFNRHKKPFACTEDLLGLLKKALQKKSPFSMVRLGDGEGRILGYPDVFEDKVYINQVLSYQYGQNVIPHLKALYGEQFLNSSMSLLKSFIHESIINADIIGAPSWLHFRNELNESNLTARAAQSICLHHVYQNAQTEYIFDHFIFKKFNSEGYFKELLKEIDEITIISHTDYSKEVMNVFGLKSVHHIKIPGHQSFMKDNTFHFPDEYKKVIDKIQDTPKESLFLVAAGYLGKHYCNQAKLSGSMAIDIGSVFDSWCGVGRKDATKNASDRLK